MSHHRGYSGKGTPEHRDDPSNLKHADKDEVKSVMEGDSVTLHTHLTDIQRRDQILWMFGPRDTRIADIHNQKPNTYDETGRFRDRLKLDGQTGSLTITNITSTDSGLYKLQIISDRETSGNAFNVNVYDRLPDLITNQTQHSTWSRFKWDCRQTFTLLCHRSSSSSGGVGGFDRDCCNSQTVADH